jgi:O-methyltransferase involved in polyketide biosynthesis
MTADDRAARHDTPRIGPTAHYTAYVWHRLGLPYADHLATRTGAILYWGFFALGEWTTRVLPGAPTMQDYLAYRHLLIDALVDDLDPDCLVELGAGLTPRTLHWSLDRGIATVDIDLPEMIEVKRAALRRLPRSLGETLGRSHRLLALDVLAPRFADELVDVIAGASRPVVVAEGLVSYFDPPARQAAFAAVAEALSRAGGGAFVVDLHTATSQAQMRGAITVLRSAIRGLTRRKRALDPFADTAAYERALAEAGFGGCRELSASDWIRARPQLATLRSPAHIVHAWV